MNILFYANWVIIAFLSAKLIIRLHAYFYLVGRPDTVVYFRSPERIYHKADCPLLNGKQRKSTLLRVHYSSYEACKICSPGVLRKKVRGDDY